MEKVTTTAGKYEKYEMGLNCLVVSCSFALSYYIAYCRRKNVPMKFKYLL